MLAERSSRLRAEREGEDREGETEIMRSSHGNQDARSHRGRFSLTRHLTGRSWNTCVDTIGTALWRVADQDRLASDCAMAFFDTAADKALHVNVTHPHPTRRISGWTGPGRTASGFVYNRTFAATPTPQILRHVRDMAFADRA